MYFSFDIHIANIDNGFCYVIAQEFEGPRDVETEVLEWGVVESFEEAISNAADFLKNMENVQTSSLRQSE